MPDMTKEQMLAKIAELQAMNEAANKAKNAIRMKIGDKGGLSVFHTSRFPTTLYDSQWRIVLSHATEIIAYLDSHKSQLSHKDTE